MSSVSRSGISLGCWAIVAIAAMPIVAQTSRGGGGGSQQQLLQLQQLASERTQLQTDNQRLKMELADLQAKFDSANREREGLAQKMAGTQASASRARSEAANLTGELEQTKSRMAELITKFRETAASLRDTELARVQLVRDLDTRGEQLESCVKDNRELLAINGEVVDRLEHNGFWSALANAEPFTRLKRTQLENLADAYRDKADDHRVDPATTSRRPGSP